MRPNSSRPPSPRSSTIGTIPCFVSSQISGSCIGVPSTNAVPRTGWPANGSSDAGVKIRIRAWPSASGGYTKTVSLNAISLASGWSRCSGISRASVKTASWFPSSGLLVNTSATTYRKDGTRTRRLPACRACSSSA